MLWSIHNVTAWRQRATVFINHADTLPRCSTSRLVDTELNAGGHTLSMAPAVDISLRSCNDARSGAPHPSYLQGHHTILTIRHAMGRGGPRSRSHSIFSVDTGHLGHPTPICSGSTNVGEDLNFTSQFEDVSYCVDRKALSRSVISVISCCVVVDILN